MHLIDKTKTPCKLLRAIHKVHDFRIGLFEQYKMTTIGGDYHQFTY